MNIKIWEAVTMKAMVLSAAKSLKTMLADKNVPQAIKDQAESLYQSMRKTWKDLETEQANESFRETANLAEWLESRLHLSLTNMADDMFGQGNVTRDERKVLSGAIGVALDGYHQFLMDNAPQLFERRPWDDAPAADMGSAMAEARSTQPTEMELTESDAGIFMPLIEKAVRGDGTIPVKIIQPGWGSSGYYPADVLERDGPAIFKKGTKMYWNHQTAQEEAERPEGDLRNLAAEFVTDARYLQNGSAGAGLYADARVFEAYKTAVDDLAPHIGVSIRAFGNAQHGSIEGREGAIITKLTNAKSVDFVTAPGAGGKVLSLFEAARGAVTKPTTTVKSVESNSQKEKGKMTEAEEKALQESVATLQKKLADVETENARLNEAQALRDARDFVEAELSKHSLPDVTRARLVESLAKAAPMKEGALDKEAFGTKIAEAVKVESVYLESIIGSGKIRGLGNSGNGDGEEFDEAKLNSQLESAFGALGLNESAAKVAAVGRA